MTDTQATCQAPNQLKYGDFAGEIRWRGLKQASDVMPHDGT